MRHASISVLALDLGTTTGWAIRASGKTVSGSTCFRPARGEAPGVRWLRFRKEFLSKFRSVREVWIEIVRRHEGVEAAHCYGAFKAYVEEWCEENSIVLHTVEVAHIKKHWAGKGNANKAAMIAKCHARGITPGDDNEADAIALLDYALEKLRGAA
jgi:hypothetical protein